MEFNKTRDSMIFEYNKRRKDLQGISPNVSIYKKLKKEMEILKEKIDNYYVGI